MLSEEQILEVLTEQVDEAIKKGDKNEINKTTDRLIRYKNVVEKNEQKKIDIENRKIDIQEKNEQKKIDIENRKIDIQEKNDRIKIEYNNDLENRKLHVEEERLEIERKQSESIFYKILAFLNAMAPVLDFSGKCVTGISGVKVAKIEAKSNKDVAQIRAATTQDVTNKMIDIEKQGEMPYMSPVKVYGKIETK